MRVTKDCYSQINVKWLHFFRVLSNICILYHIKFQLTIALYFEAGVYSSVCLQNTVMSYSMILLYINGKEVTFIYWYMGSRKKVFSWTYLMFYLKFSLHC